MQFALRRKFTPACLRFTVLKFLLVLLLIAEASRPSWGWGNQAHQMANGRAIENLPEPLRGYFRARKAYFVEHASDPDELAHSDRAEGKHHFIDAEAYEKDPFPALRKQFVDDRRGPTAQELKNGDSIWQIDLYTRRLTEALRQRHWDEADRAAVFAAHYACDLTQPLHTVMNYDGQFTHQSGIHSRFETEMVNALKDSWVLKPQPPTYESDLRARIFLEFLASYRQRNAVFAADREAVVGRTYLDLKYFPVFEKLAGPIAKQQLEAAVSLVSSLWYTAWVHAGKPELSGDRAALTGGIISTPIHEVMDSAR
jgi:hypothetical protein